MQNLLFHLAHFVSWVPLKMYHVPRVLSSQFWPSSACLFTTIQFLLWIRKGWEQERRLEHYQASHLAVRCTSELSFLLMPPCYLAKWFSGPFHPRCCSPLSNSLAIHWHGRQTDLAYPILTSKVLRAFSHTCTSESRQKLQAVWWLNSTLFQVPQVLTLAVVAWNGRHALVFLIRTHGGEYIETHVLV